MRIRSPRLHGAAKIPLAERAGFDFHLQGGKRERISQTKVGLFGSARLDLMAPITTAILILSMVAVTGLLIGSIRIRGIGLGAAGVLFSGILFGHFGATIHPEIAHFVKEFGLILFVFTMGIQLGPGIVHLWKQQGLLLNAMAAAIVIMGFLLVLAFHALLDLSVFTTAGLFSGATTNTPSLGAAEQSALMLETTSRTDVDGLAAAYAVAYPGGIIGIIASMLLMRRLFRVDVETEAKQLIENDKANHQPIERASILVDNTHLNGTRFGNIPGIDETGVRVSRVMHAGENIVHPATEQTEIRGGDVIQVVGTKSGLHRFTPLIGRTSEVDLMGQLGDVQFRRVYVTEADVLNKSLRELALDHVLGATVTRIVRSGVEMTARGSSRFHYGDIAHVVGDEAALDRVTAFLGNSAKSLNDTPFLPLFAGIGIGVMAGTIPLPIPGVPFPVTLGLAGGPLLAAVLFSIVGNVGRLVWYIPSPANHALRDLGIILFLACAGLGAGSSFFGAATSLRGLQWILAGFVITIVPLLLTGIVARLWLKQNYLTICGVIAGGMTDPPALAFANSLSESESCSAAYAAVYPLTMILRIMAAQAIVFLLL